MDKINGEILPRKYLKNIFLVTILTLLFYYNVFTIHVGKSYKESCFFFFNNSYLYRIKLMLQIFLWVNILALKIHRGFLDHYGF